MPFSIHRAVARRRRLRSALPLAVLVGAGPAVVQAETVPETRRLLWPDAATGDQLGWQVAADGVHVLAGAYLDDDLGEDAGAAVLFDAASGEVLQVLRASDGAAGDLFGVSVDLDGTRAVVGAPYQDGTGADEGAAYVFDLLTGAELLRLSDPTPDCCGDQLGTSVAIDGTLVVVGAYLDDTHGTDAGIAYVFDATTGALVHELAPDAPSAGAWFGFSVAIDGTTVVVSAVLDDEGGASAGAAYVFDAITGQQRAKLLAPVPEAGGTMGVSVAVDGTLVAVGAHRTDVGDAEDAGAVHLYDGASGAFLETLEAEAPMAGDQFGYGVAIDGTLVAVGAWADDSGAEDAGAAWIHDRRSGATRAVLGASDAAAGDWLGIDVALAGPVLVAGAPRRATEAGAAYLLDLAAPVEPGPSCPGDLAAPFGAVDFGDLLALLAAWGPCP